MQTLELQGRLSGTIYERARAACQTFPTLTPSSRATAGQEGWSRASSSVIHVTSVCAGHPCKRPKLRCSLTFGE